MVTAVTSKQLKSQNRDSCLGECVIPDPSWGLLLGHLVSSSIWIVVETYITLKLTWTAAYRHVLGLLSPPVWFMEQIAMATFERAMIAPESPVGSSGGRWWQWTTPSFVPVKAAKEPLRRPWKRKRRSCLWSFRTKKHRHCGVKESPQETADPSKPKDLFQFSL